jgi:Ca2+-binding RTX toxin-like protein
MTPRRRRAVLSVCALLCLALPDDALANTPPTITIASPAEGFKWRCSESFAYSAWGEDAEDADDSSMNYDTQTWTMERLVDGVVVQTVTAGYFHGNFSPCAKYPSVWRFTVEVTDSQGATGSATRTYGPLTSDTTLTSNIPEAQFTYDGTPAANPSTHRQTQNWPVTISASERVTSGSDVYGFRSWTSPGPTILTPSFTYTTGTADRQFLATYSRVNRVDVAAGKLRFRDPSDWPSTVSVTHEAGDLVVTDTAQLGAGPGCVQDGPRKVRCASAGVTGLDFDLGGGNDTATLSPTLPAVAIGGDGHDVITGGAAADTLDGAGGTDEVDGAGGNDSITGGWGPDTLAGGAGTNTLDGGDGDDTLRSAPGSPDTLIGGASVDAVTYATRTSAVHISANGVANDGEPGEGDNVMGDVETLVGSSYDDMLIATRTSPAHLVRTLDGRGGNDYLEPSIPTARDRMYGGAGFDRVTYHTRTDALTLRPEDMFFSAGTSGAPGEADGIHVDVEQLRGGSGNDTIFARDQTNGMILEGMGGKDTLHPRRSYQADVRGGDADDTVSYQEITEFVHVTLDGRANDGPGGKLQLTRTDVERITGGLGNDTLIGNASHNVIDGHNGDDYIEPGLGSDDILGGAGTDRVIYQFHPAAVSLSLDGVKNDGMPGENDNILGSVETLRGSAFDDTLTGNGAANLLQSVGGNDTLNPGGGSDVAESGEGDDTITVNDGVADTVLCGNGFDTVTRDAADSLNANCESANPLGGASL